MKFEICFTKKNAKTLLISLLVFEGLLVLLNVVDLCLGSPLHIHRIIDLNAEGNLPTWFSSIQLFLVGITFLLIRLNKSSSLQKDDTFLSICGLLFIFLSMDETSQFHEKITKVLSNLEWIPRFGDSDGIWILLYFLVLLGLIGISYRSVKVMFVNYKKEMLVMLTGVTLFLFGGVIVEIIGYNLYGSKLAYKIAAIIEEFFEMSGISVLLYGTLLFACKKFD